MQLDCYGDVSLNELLIRIAENITVTGLKSMDTSEQTFEVVQNDVFDVNVKDVQAVLKYILKLKVLEDALGIYIFKHVGY